MDNKTEESEFNSSIAILRRIDAIYHALIDCKMRYDLFGWYNALFVLFDELSTEFNEEERKETLNTFRKMGSKVNECIKKNSSSIPPELFYELRNLEHDLRSRQEDRNLGHKRKEEYGAIR
ncbi:MAG: hypothetical protein ACE5ES_00990 [Candidatus Nanoarchaeia archaeon]